MKIFLFGSNGFLGSFIKNNIDVHVYPVEKEYDYIINCIGKPDLEFCQKNPKISYNSNFSLLKKYIKLFPNSKFIHFSSYYVYDCEHTCTEISNTTDKYKYCEHKLLSEKLLINTGVIFRLGKLFGKSSNIQYKLTEHLITSNSVILDNVLFNPISLNQVLYAIKYELENNNLLGIYNLGSKEVVSHYEYGMFIKENFNKQLKIEVIPKHNRYFHNYNFTPHPSLRLYM
jgi:dTDP-4-dehydrorhamnose reductase